MERQAIHNIMHNPDPDDAAHDFAAKNREVTDVWGYD